MKLILFDFVSYFYNVHIYRVCPHGGPPPWRRGIDFDKPGGGEFQLKPHGVLQAFLCISDYKS